MSDLVVARNCCMARIGSARQTPYCVFQAGKQTFKDRHICAIIWCIVNIGNGYELNNNKGKTD